MQNSKSTLRLVASIIFFIVAAIALWSRAISSLTSLSYMFGNGSLNDIFMFQYFTASILLFPAALALGIIGVLQGKDKLLFWGAISVWIYCVPFVWIGTAVVSGIEVLTAYPVEGLLGSSMPDQIITIGLTAATGLVVLANQQPQVQTAGESNQVAQPTQAVESPLPILALVGAFIFPIIGIILGHMSLAQMRAGTISSRQRGLAQAALIISYIIIAIAVFAVIAFIIGIMNVMQNGWY